MQRSGESLARPIQTRPATRKSETKAARRPNENAASGAPKRARTEPYEFQEVRIDFQNSILLRRAPRRGPYGARVDFEHAWPYAPILCARALVYAPVCTRIRAALNARSSESLATLRTIAHLVSLSDCQHRVL